MADARSRLTVCVTGHAGYLGTVLVPALQAQGHRVLGLDSLLFAGCAVSGEADDDPPTAIAARTVDVRDIRPADVAGADAVVHLAGLSNDPLGDFDPALTRSINRDATIAVAEAAKSAGVRRFVFASTCSVYGAAGHDVVDETSPVDPLTAYAASKAEAERGLLALADRRFAPVVLRFATAFGFSRMLRFDLVANNLVAHALGSGRVLLKSTGDAWRPLIHVRDIAAAIAEALVAPADAVAGAVVNVGADRENHRVRSIAEAVADVVPGARIVFAEGATADRRSYRVDFSRLRRVLPGFACRWTLTSGLQDLHAHLGRIALATDDHEGPRFARLAHLRAEIAAGRMDRALRRSAPAPDPAPATATDATAR
ncbi:MAG: NAD-dependent epimerase/dehydratase family protein [Alphaproteobacteria bacterium]